MLHNIVARFDEIKLKFNQSINLLSSKGPKAIHESHQYTTVIVHRVQTMYRPCNMYNIMHRKKKFTIYVHFNLQFNNRYTLLSDLLTCEI